MKALSVQPVFASAILRGEKTSEYRSWLTRHRGLLLIHATAPVSALVGAVLITGVVPTPDGYAWLLDRPRFFVDPVPCRGRLGLWDVPDDLLEAVREQLARAAA